MAKLQHKRVGVIGMSVGSSAAFFIAQEGLCSELRIVDYDNEELSNMNRISASVIDIGIPKAVIAARRIAEFNPYLLVRTFTKGVNEENVDSFLRGLDVVVEECDSLDVKILVRIRAKKLSIPVVMETSESGLLDV